MNTTVKLITSSGRPKLFGCQYSTFLLLVSSGSGKLFPIPPPFHLHPSTIPRCCLLETLLRSKESHCQKLKTPSPSPRGHSFDSGSGDPFCGQPVTLSPASSCFEACPSGRPQNEKKPERQPVGHPQQRAAHTEARPPSGAVLTHSLRMCGPGQARTASGAGPVHGPELAQARCGARGPSPDVFAADVCAAEWALHAALHARPLSVRPAPGSLGGAAAGQLHQILAALPHSHGLFSLSQRSCLSLSLPPPPTPSS